MLSMWKRLVMLGTLGAMLVAPATSEARRHKRVVVVGAPPPPAAAARHVPSPGPGYVWVNGHPGPRGVWVAGHWDRKVPPRAGWTYVAGYWKNGHMTKGFWRPAARDGFVWVAGHRTAQGRYVPGYWKPVVTGPEGMAWRRGYWDGSAWVAGGWAPEDAVTVYDEEGELEFIGFGDGQVEELAIADPGEYLDEQALQVSDEEAAEAQALDIQPPDQEQGVDTGDPVQDQTLDIEESEVEGTKVRHHLPPE